MTKARDDRKRNDRLAFLACPASECDFIVGHKGEHLTIVAALHRVAEAGRAMAETSQGAARGLRVLAEAARGAKP